MGVLMVLMMPAFAVLAADHQPPGPQPVERALLASGLMGTIGSTIGPDGALYVAEGALGRITRIDRSSGKATTFATALPAAVPGVGIGGPMDVAFVGTTAYDGLQFALQPIGDGFLVSDGHLNRILRVSKDGSEITVLKQFNDVVPTGLTKSDGTVYLAELGPSPNTPVTGKVVSFKLFDKDPLAPAHEVAAGISMIIGAAFGPHGKLYALSQGIAPAGIQPGQPASPNTGRLLRVNYDGSFTILADTLDRPTSLNFVCDTAYIVTLTGEVWKVRDVGELADRDQGSDACDR